MHFRDTVYRYYVTDALKILGNIEVRYADVLKWDDEPKETSESIIERIRGKLSESV